jgi:hypothetical protein
VIALDVVLLWKEKKCDVALKKREKLIRIGELMSAANKNENEIMYGRSGFLCALLFVDKHVLHLPRLSHHSITRKIISQIFHEGEAIAELYDLAYGRLLFRWQCEISFDFVHGLCGILHTLLHFDCLSSEEKDLIEESLEDLTTQHLHNNSYPSLLPYYDESEEEIHQCDNAAAFTLLYAKAYAISRKTEYLNIACNAANVVWQNSYLKKGTKVSSIIPNNTYTFLTIYRLTNDRKWLLRSYQYVLFSLGICNIGEEEKEKEKDEIGENDTVNDESDDKVKDECEDRDKDEILWSLFERTEDSVSLFGGLSGNLCLLLHLLRPLSSHFPAFELH